MNLIDEPNPTHGNRLSSRFVMLDFRHALWHFSRIMNLSSRDQLEPYGRPTVSN